MTSGNLHARDTDDEHAIASPHRHRFLPAYDVTMGATVQVGFALTSHDNSQLGLAVFADPFIR